MGFIGLSGRGGGLGEKISVERRWVHPIGDIPLDEAALIEALHSRWHEQELATHERLIKDQSEDAHADLVRLLEAALSHAGPNLENVRFELALRGLGRRDAGVAARLTQIDAQRMDLFTHKFKRLTGEPQRARDLAALFYLAITGSNQALSRPNTPEALKLYLMDVITRHVIGQSAPQAGAKPG